MAKHTTKVRETTATYSVTPPKEVQEAMARPAPPGYVNVAGSIFPVDQRVDIPRVIFDRIPEEYDLTCAETAIFWFIAHEHYDWQSLHDWGPWWPQVIEHRCNLTTGEVYRALEKLLCKGLVRWKGHPFGEPYGWVTDTLEINAPPPGRR